MATETISFTCPRCDRSVDDTFYGPCSECREQMRAEVTGLARDVAAAAYEPKMNVVPNQVATKD